MPHIDPIAQPADEREIEAFKAWAKYPVPDDYLAFLRKYNGGYLAGVRPGFYNRDDETVACVSKFQHISSDPEKCINDLFRRNFSFSDVMIETDDIRDNYYAPDYYIKIANGAQHEHILMDLKTGRVFGFDDETEEELETTEAFLEHCLFLADSFDSFFSQLVDEGPE
ncbi:SMI1/KNR4 family protein [Pseudovibrio sp. POLY-S9]|uniref:SMI1/KNR4 family protein n=1 Tax=Pseudovibrio sp. POLY-S9 TaxID=1576596 RepID=UPI00070C1B57|nr:SMI1/KNR4 family protein [Pseudovibrio sp. POLY-S9]